MVRGASDGCEGSPVWECRTQTVPDVYLRGDGDVCELFQIRRSSPVCSHSPPWPWRNTEGPLVSQINVGLLVPRLEAQRHRAEYQ